MTTEYGAYDSDQTLVTDAIRGYRAWRVPHLIPRLASCAWHGGWVPGKNVAECRRFTTHHTAPAPDCTCGFYARHSDENHGYQYSTPMQGPTVCGVIKATGQIALGTAGFRAQYAEIEALYLSTTEMMSHAYWQYVEWTIGFRSGINQLCNMYKVPFIEGGFQAVVKRYPPNDLSALLPDPDPESVPCVNIQVMPGSGPVITGSGIIYQMPKPPPMHPGYWSIAPAPAPGASVIQWVADQVAKREENGK